MDNIKMKNAKNVPTPARAVKKHTNEITKKKKKNETKCIVIIGIIHKKR